MIGKKLVARTVALAVAAGGVMLSTPAAAGASGCLRSVGPVQSLGIPGTSTHVGTFYQGYNSCTRAAYAEANLYDSRAANGSGTITLTDVGTGSWSPNYRPATWWDSGYMPLNGSSMTFQADFNLKFSANGVYILCTGYSKWRYTDGAQLGAGLTCMPMP